MKRSVLCFILIISIFPLALSAKRKPEKKIIKTTQSGEYRYWGDFGLGAFEAHNGGKGRGIGLGLNLAKNKRLYKIKFNSFEEPTTAIKQPSEHIQEISGLIGKQINYRFFSLQVSAGLGAYRGLRRGDPLSDSNNNSESIYYKTIHFTTIGIPIEAGVQIIPIKHIGIGLYAESNLNSHMSTFYYSFKISIGKLR